MSTFINSVLTCDKSSLALLLETSQNTSLSNTKLNSKVRYDRPLLQVSIIDLSLKVDKENPNHTGHLLIPNHFLA